MKPMNTTTRPTTKQKSKTKTKTINCKAVTIAQPVCSGSHCFTNSTSRQSHCRVWQSWQTPEMCSVESLTEAFDDFAPFQAPDVEDERADATRRPGEGEDYADRFFNSGTTFPGDEPETKTTHSDEVPETSLTNIVNLPSVREACVALSTPILLDPVVETCELPRIGHTTTTPLSWSSHLGTNLPHSSNLLETPLWTLMNRSNPGRIHRDQASTRGAVVGLWIEMGSR